ncbi:sigma-70 family RNA polymerase sigma factor [Streptomyces sp. NBC_00829]|uniref:RNA polymerase sigma factor n=1 Tax=Streptomyces sp. NBC_00829 TaxID=2903679 RepID=UPI002F910CC1|nr:sigma-70 family RNA polymerase sigma factor [Streptomyces sp. NBC_00829]
MDVMPSPEDADGTGEAPFTLPSAFEEYLNDLTGVQYVMPPALEAFYDLYAKAHLRYAHTMLGDKAAAKAVVRRCYSHLALNWANVLKAESPEAYAFRLLKQRVETHLCLTGAGSSQMVQTAAFQHAARATLDAMRCQFEVMESALGLYTAIASLPERQYDVIVLHYVLGYRSSRIANIMGIKPDTVRSHRRLARERIATKLGLSLNPAADEEKE